MMIKAMAALAGLICLAGQASAAQKAAVLPFEIIFQVREEDFFGAPREVNDEEKQRLTDAAEQLKQLMRDSGRYEPVDVASLEADLQQQSPLYKCQCEGDFGKKVGADVVITGIFDKASESLTNVTLREHNVATGKTRSMKAVMQGNTDVAYQNVIKWLVKNRMLKSPDEAKQ
jgi:hypothetical protein